MIHRYLYDILTNGIQAIVDDDTILDELFKRNYELVPEESETIKTYFAREGLHVYPGYPKTNAEYPSVNIILASEQETENFLGDSGGMIDDEDSEYYGKEMFASVWDHTYRLLVLTEHADITAYYYEIVKYIMLEGMRPLVDDGCWDFEFSGGDLSPDASYLPEWIFARQLIFKCQREFQRFSSNSTFGRFTRVEGIHLDDGRDPADVGNVKTKLTVSTE